MGVHAAAEEEVLSWEADLAEVRARYDDLDEARDLASARQAAATGRAVAPFSSFFLPLPLIAQDVPSLEGEWIEVPVADDRGYERVDLDAQGRPVAHVLDHGSEFARANHLWWWDEDGSFLEIELMGSGPHVRRARVVDGRIMHVAAASSWADTVTLLRWDGERAVRADVAEASDGDVWLTARVASHRADGAVEVLRSVRERTTGTLASGLAAAARLVPEDVAWDGRVARPEPWPPDPFALVEPLAQALATAIGAAVAAAPLAEPFVVRLAGHGERPAFPPFVQIGDVGFRDRMRASSAEDGAALHLHLGRDTGLVVEADVIDLLSDDVLRACRVLSTALRTGAAFERQEEAARVTEPLLARLAELLNHSPPPHAADPYLVLVEDIRYENVGGMARARACLPAERVDRFEESIRPRRVSAGVQPADALTDRDALFALLSTGPLAEHAQRLAHEVATFGLLLEAGDGESRLGGPAVLPTDVPWPVSSEGPLSFLAALKLDELPAVVPGLPSSGWLLFFAGLYSEELDTYGLEDEATNTPDAQIRVLFADTVAPAEPPRGIDVLRARPVVARAVLTLPDGHDDGVALGLDTFAQAAYRDVIGELAAARSPVDEDAGDGWSWRTEHWVGGHATGVQGHPIDDGSTLLLHIGDDEELDFHFLDAGAIQFRIAPEALAARDWSQITALADSC